MQRLLPLLALLLLAPLAGCAVGRGDGRPLVVTSFYPLQYVAQRVVGAHAQVLDLTRPGVEPHDLELSPRQVAAVSAAEVVLYEKGLQPAVDQAVEQNSPQHAVDAAAVVGLRHGDGGPDPHFWLDPTLLARTASAFEQTMAAADPRHAAAYEANLAALRSELASLDHDLARGLATCRIRTVVVSHDAFEYFARRYRLDVQPIAGLSPDAEPSAQHLARLATLARETGIDTIFNERLASPRLADALAGDLGLSTAVLDPVEGLPSQDSGQDYPSLMRRNLAALREANRCA